MVRNMKEKNTVKMILMIQLRFQLQKISSKGRFILGLGVHSVISATAKCHQLNAFFMNLYPLYINLMK